jgi:hypothetical protein
MIGSNLIPHRVKFNPGPIMDIPAKETLIERAIRLMRSISPSFLKSAEINLYHGMKSITGRASTTLIGVIVGKGIERTMLPAASHTPSSFEVSRIFQSEKDRIDLGDCKISAPK